MALACLQITSRLLPDYIQIASRLRCQSNSAKVTLPRLHSQGCTVKVAQPRLRSQGYAAKITQPRLCYPGYIVKVTQPRLHPRLRSQGYAVKVTQPMLCCPGYIVKVTQTRLYNRGDIIEDPKHPTVWGRTLESMLTSDSILGFNVGFHFLDPNLGPKWVQI